MLTYAKSTLLNAVDTLTCGRPDGIAVDSILFRVEWVLGALNRASAVYNVDTSVIEALQEAKYLLGEVNEDAYYLNRPLKVFTGCKGRPKYEIPHEQLELFLEYRFSLKKMAEMLGVSAKTVGRRLKELGLSISGSYSCIIDSELDSTVSSILNDFPNCGYKRMTGFLKARGLFLQQSRIREAMRRVDPEGVLIRSFQLTTVSRRSYNVHQPLQLWHLDGNHKLIRYNKVLVRTHTCIETSSKVLHFLK